MSFIKHPVLLDFSKISGIKEGKNYFLTRLTGENMKREKPTYSTLAKGLKINMLTFTGETVKSPGRILAKFICDCGNETICRADEVVRGDKKSCGCQSKSNGWKDRKAESGELYPFKIILSRTIKQAKVRKIEVSITEQDIKDIWDRQDGLCFYTRKQLIIPNTFPEYDSNKLSPSIDRIDSSLPYTKENIQIVLKIVNYMKLEMSHDEFVEKCKQVTLYARSK